MRPASVAAALALLASPAVAAELTFDLKIEHASLSETMRLIRVHEGDRVTLRWISDRPLVLHLHGYDIEQRVAPGVTSEFAFTANATGRFPVEIHGAAGGHGAAPLAVIEVYPR